MEAKLDNSSYSSMIVQRNLIFKSVQLLSIKGVSL